MNMGSNRVDEQGGESSNRDLSDSEVNINESIPLPSHGRSGSHPSSTSTSDEDDLFDFDGGNDTSDHRIEKSKSKSRRNPQVLSASTSTAMQSNRIPSSVFSIKSGTGMDWSTTSNESLFSINVGNSSFSKDQYMMLYKSGELTKLDEQIIAQKNVLPSLKELDDMAANKSRGTGASVQTGEVEEDLNDPKMARNEEVPTANHGAHIENTSMENKHTGESHNPPVTKTASIDISFTFPVLTTADGGRLSSAYADQNKGIPAPLPNEQQPPLPQQPPEEEGQRETEITEENEPQEPVLPQNDQSRSCFSWLSCCRRS